MSGPTSRILEAAVENYRRRSSSTVDYQVLTPPQVSHGSRPYAEGGTVLVSVGETALSARSSGGTGPRVACESLSIAQNIVGPGHATDDLVRSAGGLEDMPLIVLTQGRPIQDPASVAAGVRRGWVDLQRRFAERSRRGRQVLVANSGHGIPVEAPDAVISAVREIVTTVRDGPH